MNARFEKVSRFKDVEFDMPMRKTANAAGYDMVCAEEIVVPPYNKLMTDLDFELYHQQNEEGWKQEWTLDEIAAITKKTKAKPTLVTTGVKVYLPADHYLKLAIRSSSPLKYWLVMANSEGVIDADYADNPDNEGEIFFQLINFSPVPLKIQKGDILGQGIILPYGKTEDDIAGGARTGGFGSTSV